MKEINNTRFTKRQIMALSFILPFCISGLIFALAGCYPFGNSHILVADLAGQYLPYHISFIRRVKEGSSLLWSWEAGLGFDYLFNIQLSPFNWILFLFPEQMLHAVIMPLILLKFAFAGFFMGLFLSKLTGRVTYLTPVMSSMYALCSYFAVNYWNIHFLDVYALFPLVMLGFHALMKEGKYKLYCLSLALCVLTDIGISFHICVFIALLFFGECYIQKYGKKVFIQKFAQVTGVSLIAVCLTAFVTLPFVLFFSGIGRAFSSPDTFFINQFHEAAAGFAPFRGTPPPGDKIPLLYCGLLSIIGTGLYLGNKNFLKREKTVFGVLLSLFFLGTCISYVDLALNLSVSVIGVPYRYLFIFVFMLITAAYKGITNLESFKKSHAALLAAPLLVCLLFENGMPNLAPCALLLFVYAYCVMWHAKTKKKSYAAAIAIVAVIELTYSGYMIIDGYPKPSYDEYVQKQTAAYELAQKSKSSNREFYRTDVMRQVVLYNDYNAAIQLGTNGISQWTSMFPANYPHFFMGLGLSGTKEHFVLYNETTPVIPMFTNLKYYIAYGDSVRIPSMWQIKAETEEFVLLENEYYLPLGFMVNKQLANYIPIADNPIESQNSFFAAATGLEDSLFAVLEPVNDIYSAYDVTKPQSGVYNYTLTGNETDNMTIMTEYYAAIAGAHYVYTDLSQTGSRSSDLLVIVNKDDVFYPQGSTGSELFAAGRLEEGEQLLLTVFPHYSEGSYILQTVCLNEEVLKKGYEALKDEPLIIKQQSDTYIKGAVTAKEAGLLYTSIPAGATKHWRAYVNGAEQEIIPIGGLMAALELPKGEHTIEFKYYNTHFAAGVVISACAFIASLALLYLKREPKRKANQTPRR